MKRVALFDVDSKIPNLALMKLSAFHKAMGDQVESYIPLEKNHYDLIYASKIFTSSDSSMLDPKAMQIGGTGWDFKLELPVDVEDMAPDYSLYQYPHNIGFAMRGCRLRCPFCVVPDKEGKPRPVSTIDAIWTQRSSDFIVLLDNDFFGSPLWPDCIDEIVDNNLRVNFSQGLNIRNLKPVQAEAIASVRFSNLKGTKKQVHFAWDDPRHEKLIHKGIQTAINAGIKPYQMAFYVLIGYTFPDGYTPSHEENMHRVEMLRDYGCDPYVMPYDKTDHYQRQFARWVNHKAIFKSVPWEHYRGGVYKMNDTRTTGNLELNL